MLELGHGGEPTGTLRAVSDAPAAPIDLDAARAFTKRVYGFMEGFVVAASVYFGERLGLYAALRGAGPVDAAALAERTGLHPRWVQEWLRVQGAAGLLDHLGDERFEMSPLSEAVLADESSLFYAAGAFSALPQRAANLEPLLESFRTGIGLPFDASGPAGAHATEMSFANWFRHMLVPVMLPALDGVVAKLQAGATVADVGCGGGIAVIELAKAFPTSEIHGYDISVHAIERAERNKAAAGVENAHFHLVSGEALPDDHSVDLVTTFDCVHDMTRPGEVMAAIRAAIAEDGTWLMGDIKGMPTYDENLERNPMVAMMYGISLTSCMSSGMSEPGGAGLGTLGLPEVKAREMAAAAGFSRFDVHDFGNPINLYYEIRP
jgi:hypothetical protein